MSPLLAPVFAQLITLQLGDRSEARWTKYDSARWEGTTAPLVGLSLSTRRSGFQLIYSPSLVLTPLDSEPRELLVFHNMSAGIGYQLSRHTRLQFSSSLSIGTLNFRLLGPQGQQAPTGQTNTPADSNATTGMPTTTGNPTTPSMPTAAGTPATTSPGAVGANLQQTAEDQKVHYYSSTTTLGASHQLTKAVPLSAAVGTTTAGGLGNASRADYPTLRGWFVTGATGYNYAVSARDSLVSSLTLLKTWSSNHNQAATLSGFETWGHKFAKRTSGALGTGLNITRFSQANGLRGFSIFPAFQLSFIHQAQLGRGTLSFTANAFSSPALDPLRALVDPRVGVGGGIGYNLKRLSLGSSGTTTVSIAPAAYNAGAVNSRQAEAHVGYQLGDVAQINTGVRVSHQTYQAATVFPTTWGAFVGLSLGYSVILAGRP